MITQARLKELYRYNRRTGVFTRIRTEWGRRRAGSIASTPHTKKYSYIQIVIDGRAYMAHNLAWLYVKGVYPKKFIVDHKDNNPRNTKWGNLRRATRTLNKANQKTRIDSLSQIKGVYKVRERYRAIIGKHGQRFHLGYFATARLAANAYKKAAKRLFGSFARVA